MRRAGLYYEQSNLSRAAALAAYSEEGAAWLAEAKAYVQENARVFSRLLSAAGVPLKPMRLESTFLLWVDCRGCCKNDADVVDPV